MEPFVFLILIILAIFIFLLVCRFEGFTYRNGLFLKHGFKNYYDELKRILMPYMDLPYMNDAFIRNFLEDQGRSLRQYSESISRGGKSLLYERHTDHNFVEAYAMMAILRGIKNAKEGSRFIDQVMKVFKNMESDLRERLMRKKEIPSKLYALFYLDDNFLPKELSYEKPRTSPRS